MEDYFAQNRLNWDDRAAIHVKDEAGGYRVREFLAGADNLHDIEASEIGDVSGLRIAHLQCHFGIDTLCLARRGASCAGLDFSPVAIAAARQSRSYDSVILKTLGATRLQLLGGQALEYGLLSVLLAEVDDYGCDYLVNDSYFAEYARDLVEDCGDIPRDLPHYIVIDWDATADNIRQDYTAFEFNGRTFWGR